jgi:hypothetical protein
MRDGLKLLQAYGPALVEVMRPLAAVYNGFQGLLESLAKFLSKEGVVNFITGLAKALVMLSLAFQAKMIQMFVRDMIGLIGLLFKIPAAASMASKGAGLFAKALAFLAKLTWNALGPLGRLSLLIVGIAEGLKVL